jgi:hypothetical protein
MKLHTVPPVFARCCDTSPVQTHLATHHACTAAHQQHAKHELSTAQALKLHQRTWNFNCTAVQHICVQTTPPGISTVTSPPFAPCQPCACPAAAALALLASAASLRASQSPNAMRRSLLLQSSGGRAATAAGTCVDSSRMHV